MFAAIHIELILPMWDLFFGHPGAGRLQTLKSIDLIAAEDADEEPLLPETIDDFRHITSYPSKDEVIEQFNVYVRGPLRDNVLNSVGHENGICFKLCLVATLPLVS